MQPTTFTCQQCGAALQGGMTQCPNCGMTFVAPVPLIQETNPAIPYATPQKPGPSLIGILRFAVSLGLLLWIFGTIFFFLFRDVREKQVANASGDRLKAIGQAILAYARDHDGMLPPTDSTDHFRAAIGKYVANGDDPSSYATPDGNVYYWLNPAVSQKKLVHISAPDTTELAEDTTPRFVHGRRGYHIVLYVDGHIHVAQVIVNAPHQ